MPDNIEQLIEDYLLNRLNPQQRMEFENRLSTDEQLSQQLALRRLAFKGARSAGRDRLRNRLKNIHQEVQKPPAKTRRLWPLITSLAAAVTLLLIGGTLFFRGQNLSPQELFVQNYQAYPLSLTSRGEAEELERAQLNQRYKNKDYQAALPLFEKLLSQDEKNARLLLGAGISHLELNQTKQAQTYFEAIIAAQDLRLQETARWYLALSFLKEGQVDAARIALENILKNPQAGTYQKAKQLLKDLEKK